MMWLLVPVGLYLMRGKIANLIGPYLPELDPAKTSFYGHLMTLGVAVAYVLPIELLGLGAYKRPLFMLCMWSTILTSMFTIKANYGLPQMPENLSFSIAVIKQAMATHVQPWLQKAMMGPDFPFLFFALIFLTAYPSVAPLVLLSRRSLWNVCTFASKNMPDNWLWLRFKSTWEAKLKAREAEILLYSTMGEIGLGIFLTVSILLPSRQMLVTLLYWNYLTTRFRVPRSHALHAQAWSQIGDRVEPVLKMAPFLRMPIEKAKGYFKAS